MKVRDLGDKSGGDLELNVFLIAQRLQKSGNNAIVISITFYTFRFGAQCYLYRTVLDHEDPGEKRF